MKLFSKYMLGGFVILLAFLAGGAVVLVAQGRVFQRGDFGPGGPGIGPRGEAFGRPFFRGEGPGGGVFARGSRGRGLGGEVTAVDDSSLTVQTGNNDESVVVNVTEETKIRLVESQSEGSLSDVAVGNQVQVRGQKDEDGSVAAKVIVVAPAGDRVGGRVTGVDGQTISAENPQDGSTSIVVDENTEFRLGRDGAGTLADVTEGKFVLAFGEAQGDNSFKARLVFIDQGPGPGGRPGRGGRR